MSQKKSAQIGLKISGLKYAKDIEIVKSIHYRDSVIMRMKPAYFFD